MHPKLERFIPLAIGLFAFLVVTGGWIVLPSNIAWLDHGDPRQHFLGWAFFRQGEWQFPLGLNPGFGLELGSAIAFSDSLPLLAIPFKALGPLLPDVFQYFGLWVLLCFVLQAVFGWKLAGLLSQDRLARAAMTGFFVLAPPMLWRLHGHLSLFAHFLLLAALYLSLRSRERHRSLAFAVLVTVSAAVHAYLLAMVAAIWLATLADGVWQRRARPLAALAEGAMVFAATALVCWQVGYFSVGEGVASGGYGLYRMNAASLLDADGWSRVLPDIPGGPGDYEGFNFLGLGLCVLALVALPAAWRERARIADVPRAAPFRVLLGLALTLFALSHVLGLGPFDLRLPLPGTLERIADIFRSSGRMFWPVYYVLVLAILSLAVAGLGATRARWVLLAALGLQLADTSAGWTFRQAQLRAEPASRFQTPMVDPFWAQAAGRYRTVRWMMPMNHAPQWSAIADYAVRNAMTTDATFLARIGTQALLAARTEAAARLAEGRFEAGTLYLLDLDSARAAGAAALPQDMLATIDGFHVLAPGWRSCADCAQGYALDEGALYGAMRPGEDIALADPVGAPYRLEGWGTPEEWGVWSGGDVAQLGFAQPLPERFHLVIEAQAFGPNVGEAFAFSAGGPATAVRIPAESALLAVELTATPGARTIEIAVPHAISPQALGLNEDTRRLGIGLARFRIEPLG